MGGTLVVLEGPEGAGKSTLARRLAERLREAGVAPCEVREPGGTPAAEAARAAMLDTAHPVGPVAELFLVLAARADLVARVVLPALAQGRVVLADRFDLSTMAYQVAGRGLDPATVRAANALAAQGVRPDLTLVLDIPPGLGQARQVAAGKRQDRLDRESAAFHERVIATYLAADGPGVYHLDATRSADEVLEQAWNLLRTSAPGIFFRGTA